MYQNGVYHSIGIFPTAEITSFVIATLFPSYTQSGITKSDSNMYIKSGSDRWSMHAIAKHLVNYKPMPATWLPAIGALEYFTLGFSVTAMMNEYNLPLRFTIEMA